MRRATEYRLRRTRAEHTDALAMTIVKTGPIPPPPDNGPHVLTVVDDGVAPHGLSLPLSPWTQYTWVAEVRADSDVPGEVSSEWSEASAPASAMAAAEMPEPVSELYAKSKMGPLFAPLSRATVALRWNHRSPLVAGKSPDRPYRFEIYRQLPGEHAQLLTTVVVARGRTRPDAFELEDHEPPRPGARYSIVLVDPIGRRSSAVSTVLDAAGVKT
jgi:hypothetical protein